MRLLAATAWGLTAALLAGAIVGVPLSLRRWRPPSRAKRQSLDDRLRQAGASVSVSQLVLGSLAVGGATLALLGALTGSLFVGLVPAVAVASLPATYFGRRRVRTLGAVQAAWPDALRDVLASVAAGRSLQQAIRSVAEHGPEPLREPFRRVSDHARMAGLGAALELAKHDLADPVSDRVLEVIALADETGGATVRVVLDDLVASITKDLEVAEQVETDGLEMRLNARAVVALPWLVLVALTAGRGPFRDFYRSGAGVMTIGIGLLASGAGFLIVSRLGRAPVEPRVLAPAGGAVNATVVVAATCFAIALGAAARLVVTPTRRLAPRVRPYVLSAAGAAPRRVAGVSAVPARAPVGTMRGVFGPPVQALAGRIGRLLESRSDAHLELRLAQAGLVDVSADEHRVRQVLQGAAAAVAGGLVGAVVLRAPVGAFVVAVGSGLWGVTRARAAVDRAISRRATAIRLELPTINQLLALHVRAGAGPMQAVQRVVARGHGVVVEELAAVLQHARAGGRESEAFRTAAARTPEPTAARTYELFAVAAERGADLAEGLLALGDQLREVRREEVRRQAVRRRAAMLVPTIGILAPVMLLFIAAPLPTIVLGHH